MGASPEDKSAADDKARLAQKLAALKAVRKEKGLCFKCGEKYHRGHICTPSPHLQLIEELLLLLDVKLDEDTDADEQGSDNDTDGLMHLSECAAAGTTAKKTIRLHTMLNGHQVLVLVDSGSSSNFISKAAVQRIQIPTVPVTAAKVTIADGGLMSSSEMVPAAVWSCQRHVFATD